jgi:hypothetical protein
MKIGIEKIRELALLSISIMLKNYNIYICIRFKDWALPIRISKYAWNIIHVQFLCIDIDIISANNQVYEKESSN